MKESALSFMKKLKQPWVIAILSAALIPLFPEYIAPILAAVSLTAAYFDTVPSRRGFQVGIIGKIILLYIAYMTLGLLYSPEIMSTLVTVGMWCAMFMVCLSMTTVLNNRRRFDTALFVISLTAGLIGFIGCVQYMLRVSLGLDFPAEFWNFIDKPIFNILPVEMKFGNSGVRVSSTFNNCNIFGESMIMLLPIVVYYSFYGRRKSTHLLNRFCLMMAAGGIAFSFSRGSYMGILAIAFVFAIAHIRKIVLLLLTMVSGFLLVPQPVISRLFTINESDSSINERMNIWRAGFSFIKDHPLFGVGTGISNSWSLLLQKGIDAPHMHNVILQLLVEGGIIAVVIFGMMVWKIGHTGLSMLTKDKEARMTGVLLLAFLFGFLTDSMVEFPFMTPKLIGIFLIVIALADSAARLYLGKRTSALLDVLTFQKQITDVKGERVTCTDVNNFK